MRRPVLLALAASALMIPARADDMGVCLKAEGKVAIAACTKVIESKRVDGELLALAYAGRGMRYQRVQEYDLALADYDAAIRVVPTSYRYVDRADVYRLKGEIGRAGGLSSSPGAAGDRRRSNGARGGAPGTRGARAREVKA